MTHICDLPNEILLEIVRRSGTIGRRRLSKTCRSLFSIIREQRNWRKYNVKCRIDPYIQIEAIEKEVYLVRSFDSSDDGLENDYAFVFCSSRGYQLPQPFLDVLKFSLTIYRDTTDVLGDVLALLRDYNEYYTAESLCYKCTDQLFDTRIARMLGRAQTRYRIDFEIVVDDVTEKMEDIYHDFLIAFLDFPWPHANDTDMTFFFLSCRYGEDGYGYDEEIAEEKGKTVNVWRNRMMDRLEGFCEEKKISHNFIKDQQRMSNLHAIAKEKINNFVRGHFHGHLDFDLDKTLYMFTAGRYEFTNKGGDMFIEGLARLNHYIKTTNDPRYDGVTVIAFLIYPAPSNSFNVESLKGQAVTKQLKEAVDRIKESVASRVFEACLQGKLPEADDLLEPMEKIQLKRCIMAAQKRELPPICTHNMLNPNDQVLDALRRVQLINQKHDRVKVVFHPEFLSSVSPLIGLDYEDFVRGCHLGVFPSYYEPWGYTPAECTVMGIPSISTNLSGFGCFMEDNFKQPEEYGIYVVDRRFKSPQDSAAQLANIMYEFCGQSRRQRIILRNKTERLSELLDWRKLGVFYRECRRKALERLHPEIDDIIYQNEGKVPSAAASRRGSVHSSDAEDDEE